MPIYEFRCEGVTCGKVTERLLSHKQLKKIRGVIECPYCRRKAKRIMSRSSTIFKGEGFYETDYKPKVKEKEDEV